MARLIPKRPKNLIKIRHMSCPKLQGLTLLRLMEVMSWNRWDIKTLSNLTLNIHQFEDTPEGPEFWEKVLKLEITEL